VGSDSTLRACAWMLVMRWYAAVVSTKAKVAVLAKVRFGATSAMNSGWAVWRYQFSRDLNAHARWLWSAT
jgi:hypothetical protein